MTASNLPGWHELENKEWVTGPAGGLFRGTKVGLGGAKATPKSMRKRTVTLPPAMSLLDESISGNVGPKS